MSANTARPVRVAILGSTGSVGCSTLDVIARHPNRFEVTALSAHRNVDLLWQQIQQWRPRVVVVADPGQAAGIEEQIRSAGIDTAVLEGAAGLEEVASGSDTDAVMAAIVGAAGLASTLAAVRAGKRVLLANKEALVLAGGLVMAAARESGATLLPIDSEHNAIFQCLPEGGVAGLEELGVERILLTASGGPFLRRDPVSLATVTPDEACAHPNWSMGRKISVDSATMMNKGLEVIEACWLFDTSPAWIEVVIHPQSAVHSMVRYLDGSVLAELGHADMRTPIAHALAWPGRIDAGVEPLDIAAMSDLAFERPDLERFPALALALAAARAGGTAGAVLNAANEIAVERFLAGVLPFPRIADVVEATLAEPEPAGDANSLEGLVAADRSARMRATVHADRMTEMVY